MAQTVTQPSAEKNARLAISMIVLAFGMLGVSYAAVPLYEIFCQVTGFGGTTQVAENDAARPVLEREMRVRFDANISNDIAWGFRPVQLTQTLKIGEQGLAFFEAENLTNEVITGTATFNVTPTKAGVYFAKIDCFCFTEQTLQPGEKVNMPVTYFIDPEIVNDVGLDDVTEITLSYTFYKALEN